MFMIEMAWMTHVVVFSVDRSSVQTELAKKEEALLHLNDYLVACLISIVQDQRSLNSVYQMYPILRQQVCKKNISLPKTYMDCKRELVR